MNTKIIATFLVAMSTLPAFGQNYMETKESGFGTSVEYKIDPASTEVDGSPYYAEEWQKGTMTFSDGSTFEVDAMNYNVYTQAPAYMKNDAVYYSAKSLANFTIGDAHFSYFEGEKKDEKTIFQILSTGPKIKLLKKYECSFVKGQKPKGYTEGTNDSYNVKSDYYVKRSAKPAFKIKDKKKVILKLLADKEAEIEKFLKDKRLNVKDEADLIAVFDYYATL